MSFGKEIRRDVRKNVIWTLITIDDAPKTLPGRTILDFLQLLLSQRKFPYLILDRIEGVGKPGLILELHEQWNEILRTEDFLNILPQINCFEWGDFFLFEKRPINWDNPPKDPYPNIIIQSDTTIRAVDNQYLYIYTPFQDLVNLINENYDVESITTAPLEELDYPE